MLPTELIWDALESAPDATVICDTSGSIVFVSRQVQALFGYKGEELLGGAVEQLLPERYRIAHRAHRAAFARQPRLRPMGAGLALFARRKDGSEFPVEISLSPIGEGLIVAALRDASARTRIEADLVAAREAAEQANLSKSRFLTTASHDLRQPLQALSLLNGALSRMTLDDLATEIVAQQASAIETMSGLVKTLLDISKLESGTVAPQMADFGVTELLQDLRREFAGLASTKGLQLRVEPAPAHVRSDPALLAQILRNLISNAIKYTHRGKVTVCCTRERDEVSIEVRDTGVGIAADQLPHIYEEFFRIRTTPVPTGDGYGLGLTIVRRLVKLLELQLEVQSELGRGTLFRLRLRAGVGQSTVPLASAPSTTSRRGHSTRRRILLVEDDAAVRDATRMLLGAEGFEVASAASYEEALRRTRESAGFDLVVSDYHLGGAETGADVIETLRTRFGRELPAILLTGDTSPAVKGIHLDSHLRFASKPVQAERLLALVNELLSSSAQ